MRRNTKELILNSAIAVIARDRTASLNAIIQESGLSKSVFFHHFRSKQEMLIKLVERDFDNRIKRIKELAKTLPDTPGRMLKAYVAAWGASAHLTGQEQLNALSTINEPLVRERLAEQARHMFDLLWDPAIPEMTVRIVVNACIGGWMQNLVGYRPKEELAKEREEVARGLIHIIEDATKTVSTGNAETAPPATE